MKKPLYSAAPWHVGDKGEAPNYCSHIIAADGNKVCTVESYPFQTIGKTDAKLIAHAPELLVALKLLINACDTLSLSKRTHQLNSEVLQAKALVEKFKK